METIEYDVVWRHSEHGLSSVGIQCPYCNAITTAYIWSLSGSGKRCHGSKCDAIFYRTGAQLSPKKKARQGGAK